MSDFTGQDLKRVLKASYEPNKKAKKTLAKSGFELDKKLSGQRAKVFTDRVGRGNVSFRGTNNLHDVATDLSIGVGLLPITKRFKHTKKVMRQAQQKYGDVNTMSHSLGGILSERSGARGNIITYNKASLGDKSSKRKKGRQTDIRTKGDIVSVLTPAHSSNITLENNKPHYILKMHGLGHLKTIKDKVIFS